MLNMRSMPNMLRKGSSGNGKGGDSPGKKVLARSSERGRRDRPSASEGGFLVLFGMLRMVGMPRGQCGRGQGLKLPGLSRSRAPAVKTLVLLERQEQSGQVFFLANL